MPYRGTVHVERHTACPFSVAQEYAKDYLREAESGGERAFLSAGPLRKRVVFAYATHTDATEPGRAHEEIVLSWLAGSPLLPDFKGTLKMRIEVPGTILVLDGRYVPPGGALGWLFDRVAGKRIAKATAESFLTDVAGTLTERERAWRGEAERRDPEAVS